MCILCSRLFLMIRRAPRSSLNPSATIESSPRLLQDGQVHSQSTPRGAGPHSVYTQRDRCTLSLHPEGQVHAQSTPRGTGARSVYTQRNTDKLTLDLQEIEKAQC